MSCSSFARIIISTVNLLILIGCGVVMYVGYSKVAAGDETKYYELFNKSTGFMIFIMVIVLCFVVCVIGMLLCCFDSKCWRVLYCVALTVVIVGEVVCVIIIFMYTEATLDYVEEQWEKVDTNEAIRNAVMSAELTFKCCGFRKTDLSDLVRCMSYNQSDYHFIEYSSTKCAEKMEEVIADNLQTFGIGAAVILGAEIILYIFSIYYACLSKEAVRGGNGIDDITKP